MAIGELKLQGPGLLRDGTAVSDLVDVDRRRVSARVFVDPEIHQLELRKVFGRTWCFVGHTSEIPSEHDFVLRRLAGDPVIVSQADDGDVHVS
ncbi:MAG: hypothetical protein QOD57_4840, partial [Actinomycetota bacterium]|nr:hypothetical protein [Actinomycetota bacterium]